ncbi:BLUF domain-containing protein [Thalassomonas sp. RHCl1]|uniref:BLUF domain-containing protein n=1 Tax=Thalassomonas sp. RHCl1 TaxID=2995320 RepID=UPI00248ACED7|nr:BLUF domain-containing protein [Thalassomonas sp. RHCl1]
MVHLIYTSSAVGVPNEQDLTELLEQARARNIRQNITGMLLYANGTYMQVLEGDSRDVHDIYASIKKDPRNTNVLTLVEEVIPARSFPDWSMGFRNLTVCSPEDLPGFIDVLNEQAKHKIVIKDEGISKKLLANFVQLNYEQPTKRF